MNVVVQLFNPPVKRCSIAAVVPIAIKPKPIYSLIIAKQFTQLILHKQEVTVVIGPKPSSGIMAR